MIAFLCENVKIPTTFICDPTLQMLEGQESMKNSNSVTCDLKDVLSVFDTATSAADIIAAKALAGISAEIVKHRISLGMTQKQFAEYMEVSQGMVSKWESADYNFSVKSLAHIAAKLDMDIAVCFTELKI